MWYCIQRMPSTSDVRGSLATGIIKQVKKLYNNPKIDILDKYVSGNDDE